MVKEDIKSMTLSELTDKITGLGMKPFRAKQIYSWLSKGTPDFMQMTDLPEALRIKISEIFFISSAKIEKRLASNVDNTVKYLYALNDGKYVESVLMQYEHGYSMCISTQSGCRMGCRFCATGQGVFERNLLPSEMLAQIQAAQLDNNIRISNVVLMGMGEPLDNFENVIRFLQLVSSADGLNIGMRHITLYTCGIVDKIYELMKYKFQLTLSISLHAPNDRTRNKIMPVNRKWGIQSILEACHKYVEVTGRRVSFEYAMIDGVNDNLECAEELAEKLHGLNCHVNLIPVNTIDGNNFNKSSKTRINKFMDILINSNINITVRRTLGADINASCGQLKGKKKEVLN